MADRPMFLAVDVRSDCPTLGGAVVGRAAWRAAAALPWLGLRRGRLRCGAGDAATAASICFAGGLFVDTGAYASLLGAINAPRIVTPVTALTVKRWRWWSNEPHAIDWLSMFVLLIGTLAYAINLIDSFLQGDDAAGEPADLGAGGRGVRAVPDLGASRDDRDLPPLSALRAAARSPAGPSDRVDPVHGFRARRVHQA
jgi:hypothetical protein